MSSSSLAARGLPIYPFTGVDLSASLGKTITFTAGVPAVSASATVPATGVVLEGNVAAKQSSIGILGANLPPVSVLISSTSAALSPGDGLMQAADGTLTKDTGSGARVVCGVLTDPNGAIAGDLAEAVVFPGQIRS